MYNFPIFTTSVRRKRRDPGYEPRAVGETGAALWITTAVIIVIVAGFSFFATDDLRNGGGPFVITPSSDITASQTYNH